MDSQGTQGMVDTSSTFAGTQGITGTPQAPELEVNQGLHAQHRDEHGSADSVPLQKGPKQYKDSTGRKQVSWTGRHEENSESDGNMHLDDDDLISCG